MRNSITLRGAAANAFIAAAHRDEDLEGALARSCGPARQAVIVEIVQRSVKVPGVCVKCGCTEEDCSGCVARTGAPCSWVDATRTLCSACVEKRFHFQWHAHGADHACEIEACDYASACYKLAFRHVRLYGDNFPADFKLILRTPEVVG